MPKSQTSLERRLLTLIVETARERPEGSISLRESVSRLQSTVEDVDVAVKSLARQGLVELRELLDGFYVAAPTPLGDKEYMSWETQRNARLTTPLKTVGAIVMAPLVAAAIIFVVWYLGFSPDSTTVVPREGQSAVKIYYPSEEWPNLGVMWMVNNVDAMKRSISNSDPLYETHFSDATPASPTGEWYYEFDIENTSKLSQVNLREVVAEFAWEPISDTVDLYENPHGLGAGAIRELEVTLSPDGTAKPQVHVSKADPAKGAQFDYVSLSPGERETIGLNLGLSSPGRYHITPIARFALGDQNFEQRLKDFGLVVPESYHLWYTSENGSGKLVSYPFTVSRAKGNVRLDNLVLQPPPRPLVFETTVPDGTCRVFLVEGSTVREVADENQMFDCAGKLKWTNDGTAIIYEESPFVDKANAIRVDLATGTKSVIGPVSPEIKKELPAENRAYVEMRYGSDYSDPFWSPQEDRIALMIIEHDSKISNSYGSGKIILVPSGSSNAVEVEAPEWCDSPSWSPSGQRVAFICRTPRPEGYIPAEGDVWVADAASGDAFRISRVAAPYRDLAWSEDEKNVLAGGNGARVLYTDVGLQPLTIFELNYDCSGCIGSPKWKPAE